MTECKKCGTNDRYSSGKCKCCVKAANSERYQKFKDIEKAKAAARYKASPNRVIEQNKVWRDANKDRVNALERARYAKNPSHKQASNAKWAMENQERNRERFAVWAANNRESRAITKQNRRARESLGKLSRNLVNKLFELQRGKCACGCKRPLGADYHLDHRMPLALGGSNTDDNMQLLRKVCNLQKSAKHPVAFMQSRGYLL